MLYYRSIAYIISQGFQKVLICYFTIFVPFTMNFQSFSHIMHKEKDKGKPSCIEAPELFTN
jgi:hypothetical protein